MSIDKWEPEPREMTLAQTQDVAVQRLGEWARNADAAYQIAERLSQSSFVPQQFRGKPVELTAAMLAGLEVGLSPRTAMRSFDIISGQAAPRAITLRAVVQSHGHEMVLVESTATRCRMKGRRKGSQEWQTVTWTLDRARDLGLVNKDNWKKQPAAMLTARATSELARLIASDAILGIGYSSEEVADGGAYDEQVGTDTTTTAPAPTTRRMSRPRPVHATPEPDEEPDPHAPGPNDEPLPIESPLLDTSSALAKAMFATLGELGVTEKAERLGYVSMVLDRQIASSTEMTEADARAVIDRAKADLEQPFEAPVAP